jgi:uncharacterized protein with NAD-binding domain and iron-sulfur cluster
MSKDRPRKIAILGAGPAGLAAAFALSDPAVHDDHEITVYQMGWRAGGKCATGRNPERGGRVEQNGSHYLFGCYHHSFQLARAVYDELERRGDSRFGCLAEEFTPVNLLAGQRFTEDNQPELWFRNFPANLGQPGTKGKYMQPFDYMLVIFQLLLGVLFGVVNTAARPARSVTWVMALFSLSPFTPPAGRRSLSWYWGRFVRFLLAGPAFLTNRAVFPALGLLLRFTRWCFVRLVNDGTRRRLAASTLARVVGFLRALRDQVVAFFGRVQRLDALLGPFWRARFFRIQVLSELVFTAAFGVVADQLWRPGALLALDHEDFRAWLVRHGAHDTRTAQSPYVKCWYDAVAAYEDGDPQRPRMSAGVALHVLFRAIWTYKGNFAFQMRHEVGDSLIAPLVAVLMHRGVRFEFFSRVKQVLPDNDEQGSYVREIVIEPQLAPELATPPLFTSSVPAPGHPGGPRAVWPDRPLFENAELARAARATESFYGPQSQREQRLLHGQHFTDVIFSLPVASIPHCASAIAAEQPSWQVMHENIKATETMSLRAWFNIDRRGLGWLYPNPIVSAISGPFSTWEDNGQSVGTDLQLPNQKVKAIATLFGPLPAPPHAPGPGPEGDRHVAQQEQKVAACRADFLARHALPLWDGLMDPESGGINYQAFCAPEGLAGVERAHWQLLRANVGPLERYTQALPGTLPMRLRADESGYRNMVLAGEWTRNGVEVGCVEGAIMSGLLASRAVSGYPQVVAGEREEEFGLFT